MQFPGENTLRLFLHACAKEPDVSMETGANIRIGGLDAGILDCLPMLHYIDLQQFLL
jgi:hypothetical protein